MWAPNALGKIFLQICIMYMHFGNLAVDVEVDELVSMVALRQRVPISLLLVK